MHEWERESFGAHSKFRINEARRRRAQDVSQLARNRGGEGEERFRDRDHRTGYVQLVFFAAKDAEKEEQGRRFGGKVCVFQERLGPHVLLVSQVQGSSL